MRAVRKCCICCYPRLWSKKVDDGFASEATVFGHGHDGHDELDLEDPTPSLETQSQTYRCEVVLPETVVQEGCMVHGFHLPPWDDDVKSLKRALEFQPQAAPVSLSKMQKAALRDWCSMSTWLERQGYDGVELTIFEGMPKASKIRQGRVTDCSLMSVLSVLADYDDRCGRSTLQTIVQGRITKSSRNRADDYACRLFVNGISRCVLVDDLVPVGSSGKLLCAHSACPHELWVVLIEKAVAKIIGGSYAMRGSNPSTDAFHLTGWIPETFPLKDEESLCTSQADWLRIFDTAQQGFWQGKCVLCVGTTELPDATSSQLALQSGYSEGVSSSTGLVAGHAYPVLQCCSEDGLRLLYLKNPWGHTRWKGRYAPGDSLWKSNSALASKLGYDSEAAAAVDDGAFWIPWEEVLRYFSHFYISWSPLALGLNQLQAHGCWNPWPHFVQSILPDDTDILAFNPQFHLRLLGPLPSEAIGNIGIWVVLSRHIRSRTDYNSHFISVSIYNGKTRICCPNSVLEQGIFSNGECALVKLHNDAASSQDFTVVVSQHGAKRAFNYTLQVYTAGPATLQDLPPLVPSSYASGAVRGEWTQRTAGGCSNSVWSFFQNPQWSFTVPPEGLQELILFLECQDVSVNLRLFSDAVARPEALRSATSSGAYRRGCCMLRLTDLEPNTYVLVVSTFRPGVRGSYRLAWHASSSVTLSPQPYPFVEGALAHPLKSVVQNVHMGSMVEMQLRLVDQSTSTGQACRVSVRLQGTYDGGEMPYLELSSAHPSRQAPYCVRLKASDADQYFQLTGASVILFAQLKPLESYVLRTKVPRSRGAKSAKLYVHSDRLVVLDSLMSPRGRRR